MASELKQILRPAADPTNDGGGWISGVVAEDVVATAADLRDGSDLTYEDLHGSDDGFAGPNGAIVFYMAMDTLTYSGPIDFVRYHIRSRYTETPGSHRVFDTILGHKNGFYTLTHVLGANGFVDHVTDQTQDPQTHVAWTQAGINAGLFGFRVDGEGDPAFCDGHVLISEFWIEVWGPPSATTPPVWSIPANGGESIREGYGYSTDVLGGYNLAEQRVSRRSRPLESYEFGIVSEGREAQLAMALRYGLQGVEIVVPLWHYGSALTAAVGAGDLLMPIPDAQVVPYRVGGYAILWRDAFTWDVLMVSGTSGSGVSTSDGPTVTWPAGTLIMPARRGMLNDHVALQRLTSRVLGGRVGFTMEQEGVI